MSDRRRGRIPFHNTRARHPQVGDATFLSIHPHLLGTGPEVLPGQLLTSLLKPTAVQRCSSCLLSCRSGTRSGPLLVWARVCHHPSGPAYNRTCVPGTRDPELLNRSSGHAGHYWSSVLRVGRSHKQPASISTVGSHGSSAGRTADLTALPYVARLHTDEPALSDWMTNVTTDKKRRIRPRCVRVQHTSHVRPSARRPRTRYSLVRICAEGVATHGTATARAALLRASVRQRPRPGLRRLVRPTRSGALRIACGGPKHTLSESNSAIHHAHPTPSHDGLALSGILSRHPDAFQHPVT